jgi:hypothetical protein
MVYVSIDAIETTNFISELESLVFHSDLGGVSYNRQVLAEKVKVRVSITSTVDST